MFNDTQRLIIVLLLIVLGPSTLAEASSQKGNRFYSKGNYKESVEEFQEALAKDKESDIINFNAGTALYKNGQYPEAIKHLQKALLTDSDKLRQKSHYNLGNSLYKFGKAQEGQDIGLAIESLEKSVSQFAEALKLSDKDEDAKFNYDFVTKELEKLKQKQESQQSQNDQNQQSQDQKQQNQDQKNQQEKSQDQKQQDSEQKQGGEESKEKQEEPQDKSGQSDQAEEQKADNNEEQKSQQSQDQENREQDQRDSQARNSGQEQNGQPEVAPQTAVSSVGDIDPQELSEQEAKMLLEGYEQSIEPKNLMNFQIINNRTQPVSKDW